MLTTDKIDLAALWHVNGLKVEIAWHGRVVEFKTPNCAEGDEITEAFAMDHVLAVPIKSFCKMQKKFYRMIKAGMKEGN